MARTGTTAKLGPGGIDRTLSIAPMMEWTDRHDRYFLRLISRHVLLYTEMVAVEAVLHGDRDRLLGFETAEHPVAVQLGGSDPGKLAEAARIAEDFGYDEINLNVGCPSKRVQSGSFGACLMTEPALIGKCLAAMQAAVRVPVTVKCRIGVDDQDGERSLDDFIDAVWDAGIVTVIIHARKAWLSGLNPKQNRDVPPLDYDRVIRLKAARPKLEVVLNGGIQTLDEARRHLTVLNGVMIGRAAYHNPYMLARADEMFFADRDAPPDRSGVVAHMIPYIERACASGVPLHAITRHILGLFFGLPGARAWRRHLSENAHLPGAGANVVRDALALVSTAARRDPIRVSDYIRPPARSRTTPYRCS